MKRQYSLLFLLLVGHMAAAQNLWTWVGGNKSVNIEGNYGTTGVAAPSNIPGSRAGAASWIDNEGNFWLFGGIGSGESSGNGLLNDLWKYNPNTQQWTWMGGSKSLNTPGIYGTRGSPSPNNQPGARRYAMSWKDNNGNFWLFGGHGLTGDNEGNDDGGDGGPNNGNGGRGNGNGRDGGDDAALDADEGLLNDLWKYSPSTGQWTWISGTNRADREGEYGERREGSESNYPGGRFMSTGWKDANGNLWLYGGRGYSSEDEISNLSDLWRYSPSSNEWTWMKGDRKGKENILYGDKGEFDDENNPGGRTGSAGLTDRQGKFWLFGGVNREGLFSDLWKYDPLRNEWAWMSGSKNPDREPRFSNVGVPDAENNPGSRMLSAGWVDAQGNLWIFGGEGYGSNRTPLNSIWRYAVSSNEWTFIKGEASRLPSAIYGTQGTPGPSNTPGGTSGASNWQDNNNKFWIFGGESMAGNLNQIWNFTHSAAVDPPCGNQHPGPISPAVAGICEGSSQVLTVTGGTSYQWRLNDVVIEGQTGSTVTATKPGTYSVIIFINDTCTMAASNTAVVTIVKPSGNISPANSSICEGGSQVLTATGGDSYTWMRDGTVIAGEKSETYNATAPGVYSVIIKKGDCSAPASNTATVNKTTAPSGNITPATASICGGDTPVLTASGGTSYTWLRDGVQIDGQNSARLTVTQAGVYSVIIRNGQCTGEAMNKVTVTTQNAGGVRYANVSTTPNEPVQLAARETGISYEWIPTSGLDNPSSATPKAHVNTNTEYVVRITTDKGCTITDTILVLVTVPNAEDKIFVPKAFTPDGNGVNDVLRPLGNIGTLDYFRVYNRWGQLMYQTSTPGVGWDGKSKGVDQPSDTYAWLLLGKTPGGQQLKLSGKTLLIR